MDDKNPVGNGQILISFIRLEAIEKDPFSGCSCPVIYNWKAAKDGKLTIVFHPSWLRIQGHILLAGPDGFITQPSIILAGNGTLSSTSAIRIGCATLPNRFKNQQVFFSSNSIDDFFSRIKNKKSRPV